MIFRRANARRHRTAPYRFAAHGREVYLAAAHWPMRWASRRAPQTG
jgi:hypothetical protein